MKPLVFALLIALLSAAACSPHAGSAPLPQDPAPAPEPAAAEPKEAPVLGTTLFAAGEVSGEARTEFRADEDIVFHYLVTNPDETTIQCQKPDGGPAVRFSIYREGQRVAHDTEGLAFIQMIMLVELPPGERVFSSSRMEWEAFRERPALPAGAYTARAEPVLQCPGISLADQVMEFSVTAD